MAEILSPMAGKVTNILVKPGDSVSDGDEVVMLESMKMEIPVMSEDDGIVKTVHVSPNSPVEAGTLLITLE